VGLSQSQDERLFGLILGIERVAKALEYFQVFVLVLFGEDDESAGAEAVFGRVGAAFFFAGFGLRSAFGAVAAIGG
jgi:hypothetical protein